MKPPELIDILEDYKTTEEKWLNILDGTMEETLIIKPSVAEWSLGQVYSHWIDASHLYMLAKIKICLNNTESHLDGELSPDGIKLFETNEFPISQAKVPVKTSGGPDNEGDKNYLKTRIKHLHIDMEKSYSALKDNPKSGKSGHRLFGFMDAHQWFGLVPVHMRHHFKQHEKEKT